MVIKILEVGIPVWKAKEVLPRALNSLVSQTKKNFIVTLSIDGDDENYDDIINEYRRRGLKIKTLINETNRGPGMARQLILDNTQCDFITFLDADDILLPRAVEVLYREAKLRDYDLIQSGFYRENDTTDSLIAPSGSTITWFHGKIYKVSFLKEKNVRFLPNLRVDEDAYFNAVIWNITDKRGQIDEPMYLWCNNKRSITRELENEEFFNKNYFNYIYSQVEGLKTIYKITGKMPNNFFCCNTLMNIYYYYMHAKFNRLNEKIMIDEISSLADEPWIKEFSNNLENWRYIIENIKTGQIYEETNVVFFTETFDKWAYRLLLRRQ